MARTQLYYITFLPSSTRSWNELAPEIRDSSFIQSFNISNKNLTKPLNIIIMAIDFYTGLSNKLSNFGFSVQIYTRQSTF